MCLFYTSSITKKKLKIYSFARASFFCGHDHGNNIWYKNKNEIKQQQICHIQFPFLNETNEEMLNDSSEAHDW